MRGIADAQQPRTIPLAQPIDLDRQETDVVPRPQLLDAVAKRRRKLDNQSSERFDSPGLQLLGRALRDDKAALPVVAPVDHDENHAGAHTAKRLGAVAWPPRQ